MRAKQNFFSRAALGFVVAATGVGAGDLLTASLAGSSVGLVILWAAWAGALLKFVLNEGIARWQMATNRSILEGWLLHLPSIFPWLFFFYFILWSFYVGGALINACGVAGVGFISFGRPGLARIIWGCLHSLAGLILVWRGGFELFQRLMTYLTAAMVITVFLSVILIKPDWLLVLKGILWPSFPRSGSSWLLAVMGGVGGTVTIICYGYWIKEKMRQGGEGLKECRFDLGVGYALTAFFGLAMIIIGSRITVKGRGDEVAWQLADSLGQVLGPAGKILFLAGFWSAVFSSLLGVWQGVPYIFADFLRISRRSRLIKLLRGEMNEEGGKSRQEEPERKSFPEEKSPLEMNEDLTRSWPYRLYLLAISFLPLVTLLFTVQKIQLIYALLGAFFMPFLALTLLILNNKRNLVPPDFLNGWLTNFFLIISLLFFSYCGWREIRPLLLSLF
jgi:Mn2+/Fe2+ NRAMP family transporter